VTAQAQTAAYLCLHQVGPVQTARQSRVSTDPQMVSRGVVLIALIAPLALAAEMVANCWVHGKTREACDPDAQVPEMVQAVVTSAFAWMATPPH
jgi:hypothetical protein